jgi:hypothetical protein
VNREKRLKADRVDLFNLPASVRVGVHASDSKLVVARVKGPRELNGLMRQIELAETVGDGVDRAPVRSARISGQKVETTDDPRVVVVDGREYRDPGRIQVTVDMAPEMDAWIADNGAQGRYQIEDIGSNLRVAGTAGRVFAGRIGELSVVSGGDQLVTAEEVRGDMYIDLGERDAPVGSDPRVTVRSGHAGRVWATVNRGAFEFGGVADFARVEATGGRAQIEQVTSALDTSGSLPGQVAVAWPPGSDLRQVRGAHLDPRTADAEAPASPRDQLDTGAAPRRSPLDALGEDMDRDTGTLPDLDAPSGPGEDWTGPNGPGEPSPPPAGPADGPV